MVQPSQPSDPLPPSEIFEKQLVNVASIHRNVAQVVIITTEDKVRICVMNHLKRLETKREWITPFGIWLALIITLTTTQTVDFILSAEAWRDLYIFSTIVISGWLLLALMAARNSASLDDFLRELKSDTK